MQQEFLKIESVDYSSAVWGIFMCTASSTVCCALCICSCGMAWQGKQNCLRYTLFGRSVGWSVVCVPPFHCRHPLTKPFYLFPKAYNNICIPHWVKIYYRQSLHAHRTETHDERSAYQITFSSETIYIER